MPFKDAMALVNDDLPDGAYWAMAHEFAGLEYGDGFDELIDDPDWKEVPQKVVRHCRCIVCHRRFHTDDALKSHVAATGHTPVDCPSCKKKFGTARDLEQHAAMKHALEDAAP